jgi:purine nucleosidase
MISVPMLVDVDTGVDDALALLYACASPEIELLGVTCVSGNVHRDLAARNSLAVLELAGRSDVEVALGAEAPLRRPITFDEVVHGPGGVGHAEVAEPSRPLADGHAADLLIDRVQARPGEVTLVTLGPMTNLAIALEREPHLPSMVRRFVFMGGAFRHPGNATPGAEANIYTDPEAAEQVFAAFGAEGAAPARPVGVGLDVTELVTLHQQDLDAICNSNEDGALARFIRDAVTFYMGFYRSSHGSNGAAMHDPLALAVAVDPALVRTEPVAVEVEVSGDHTTGATVADWNRVWKRRPNLDVAVEVDAPAFLSRFIGRLAGLVARSAS